MFQTDDASTIVPSAEILSLVELDLEISSLFMKRTNCLCVCVCYFFEAPSGYPGRSTRLSSQYWSNPRLIPRVPRSSPSPHRTVRASGLARWGEMFTKGFEQSLIGEQTQQLTAVLTAGTRTHIELD